MKHIYFIALALFLSVLIVPLMSATTNSTIIYFDFTQPNGVLGNPHLIWNNGTGSSGVSLNATNGGSINLLNSILQQEIIPYGSGNNFADVYDTQLLSSFIGTNNHGYQTDESFSFSTWIKPDVPLEIGIVTTYTANTFILENPFLDFRLIHFSTILGSPNVKKKDLSLSYGGTSCVLTNALSNTLTWNGYHQIGFVYNESNRLSGNLITLYIDGNAVKNCTNTGLTGTFNMSRNTNFYIGAKPNNYFNLSQGANLGSVFNPYGTSDIRYTNTILFDYAVNSSVMQSLYNNNESSYISPTAPQIVSFIGETYYTPVVFHMNDYYSNYNNITVSYYDTYLNTNVTLSSILNGSSDISNCAISVNVQPVLNDIYLQLSAGLETFSGEITVTAVNPYGSNTQFFTIISNTTSFSLPQRFVDFQDTFISSFIAYSINGHYSNYDRFNVSWFDTTLNSTQTISKLIGDSRTVIEGDVNVTLDGVINPNDILFKIQTLNKNANTTFTVRAINNNGYDEQIFTIMTVLTTEEFSYTRTFLSGFTDFFPDSETLTNAEGYAFALLTILASITAILIMGKEHIQVALVLASITSILEFIYFVFIGYISIGVVITLILAGIVVSFFKWRIGQG